MHFNAPNNDQLLLQHPPIGINSYGHKICQKVPTVWNKVPDYIQYVTQSVSLPPLEDWGSCGESSLPRLCKNKKNKKYVAHHQ